MTDNGTHTLEDVIIAIANQAPGQLTLTGNRVAENSQSHTEIGYFNAIDPDGDEITYELVDNAGGRFKLVGNKLFVDDGSKLDYETATYHSITIRAIDSNNNSSEETFTIDVTDVNETGKNLPPYVMMTGISVSENAANSTEVGYFTSFDPENDPVTYRLVDNAGGRFKLVGNKLVVANGAKIDYEATPTIDITVRVTDSHGNSRLGTFTLSVRDVKEEVIFGTKGNDAFIGGSRNDKLFGGNGHDKLDGGRGNDKLDGGSGRDVLTGGLGRDALKGGSGKDAFLFNTKLGKAHVDQITDFSVRDDTIHLAKSVFTKIGGKGKLSADAFWIGAAAESADHRVIYNKKTGVLSYDADGSGAGQASVIAKLKAGLNMSEKDFLIV